MKEIDVKLCVPVESIYVNKSIKFKIENVEELERELIDFFSNSDLKELINHETGNIKNIYAFSYSDKIYHNIKDVELNDCNKLTVFAYVLGG